MFNLIKNCFKLLNNKNLSSLIDFASNETNITKLNIISGDNFDLRQKRSFFRTYDSQTFSDLLNRDHFKGIKFYIDSIFDSESNTMEVFARSFDSFPDIYITLLYHIDPNVSRIFDLFNQDHESFRDFFNKETAMTIQDKYDVYAFTNILDCYLKDYIENYEDFRKEYDKIVTTESSYTRRLQFDLDILTFEDINHPASFQNIECNLFFLPDESIIFSGEYKNINSFMKEQCQPAILAIVENDIYNQVEYESMAKSIFIGANR